MTRQQALYARMTATYVLAFPVLIYLSGANGMTVTRCVGIAAILSLISPLLFWYLELSSNFEGRSKKIVFNWRWQSWSFYGDLVFLMPAIVLATYARQEHRDALPWWGHQWWWAFVSAAAGFAFGWFFRNQDNGRYLPESLASPSKLYHDYVLIPIYFGMLIAQVLPVLWAWDGNAHLCVWLIGGWCFLAVLDGIRSYTGWNFRRLPHWCFRLFHQYRLDPVIQHVKWNKVAFAPLTR